MTAQFKYAPNPISDKISLISRKSAHPFYHLDSCLQLKARRQANCTSSRPLHSENAVARDYTLIDTAPTTHPCPLAQTRPRPAPLRDTHPDHSCLLPPHHRENASHTPRKLVPRPRQILHLQDTPPNALLPRHNSSRLDRRPPERLRHTGLWVAGSGPDWLCDLYVSLPTLPHFLQASDMTVMLTTPCGI